MTPTEMAEVSFEAAMGNFRAASNNSDIRFIAFGLTQMASGMQELAIGIRATYKKVEELEKTIRRQNTPF